MIYVGYHSLTDSSFAPYDSATNELNVGSNVTKLVIVKYVRVDNERAGYKGIKALHSPTKRTAGDLPLQIT